MRRLGHLVVACLAGCASGGRETNVGLLHTVSDDAIVTPNLRLDPASWVRMRLVRGRCRDGCPTEWIPADALEAGSAGLTVRLPLDGELIQVTVTRVGTERLRQLSQLKVRGTIASDLNDGIILSGPRVADWLRAARDLGPIPETERWVLSLHGLEVEASDGTLPEVWMEHFRWDEIESVDVVGSRAFTDRSTADHVRLPLGGHEGVASDDSQPLFTAAAVRRARVRPHLAVEAGTDALQEFADTQASIEVGVRLFNLFEVGAGMRALWQPVGPTSLVADGPLEPVHPRSVPELLGTVRTGVAVDLDDERRWTVQGGLELAFGPRTLRERVIVGVRARLWKGTFVALRPITPEHSAAGWTVSSSVQVGAGF
jgi:hypothetical protein